MVELKKIPISSIIVTGDNPRQNFPEESLRPLGESMLTHGQIDPIIVRPKGNIYELVAGERRWRAAQLVGIAELEAKVQELDDANCAELRLIENTQREDLTYAEKGDAVLSLMEKYPDKYPTVTAVAKALCVLSSHIQTYWLSSSKRLSPKLREMTSTGEMKERLAIYLLKYDYTTQDKLAKVIVDHDLSGHENADISKFLKLYDENPNASLEELAKESKGTKYVRIDTAQLTPEAKKEIETIINERKNEIKKYRKESINKARPNQLRHGPVKRSVNTPPNKTKRSCVSPESQPSQTPILTPIRLETEAKSIAVALSYPLPTFERLMKFMGIKKMVVGDAIAYLTEKGLEVEGC